MMRYIAFLWLLAARKYWETVMRNHGLVTYVDSYRLAQTRRNAVLRKLRGW